MAISSEARMAHIGGLVLPKRVREALCLAGSEPVVFFIESDQVRLSSIQHCVQRAQDLYRLYAKNDANVDEFIAERRVEAASDKGTQGIQSS